MKKYALWALLLVAIILLFIIIVGVDEINQSRNVLNLTDKKEIYVANRSIFYFLRKAGYILRVDLNEHVISIFSANPY